MVLGAEEGRSAPRSDGRRPLYVYLHPDLILNLKKAALDDNRPVYELVEEAVTHLLDARREGVAMGGKK